MLNQPASSSVGGEWLLCYKRKCFGGRRLAYDCSMQTESLDEKIGRWVVSLDRRVPVRRFDTGAENSQVDAFIDYADGSAPLEFFATTDPAFRHLSASIRRLSITPKDGKSWYVSLSTSVVLKTLLPTLPDQLVGLPREGLEAKKGTPPANLRLAGVRRVMPISDGEPRIEFGTPPVLSAEGDLNAFITRTLDAAPDVASKLRRHSVDGRGEAFIFVDSLSSTPAWGVLRHRGMRLPLEPPTFPDGVSAVWLGSWLEDRDMGYLRVDSSGWVRSSVILTANVLHDALQLGDDEIADATHR